MWQWRNGLLLRILSGQNSKVKEFHVKKYSPKDKMFTLVEKFIVRIFSFSGAIWNVYFGRYYRRKIPIHIIDENPANHHLRAQAELSFFSTPFNSGEYEILDLFPHTRVSFNAIFKLKATIQKMLLKNSAVLSVWISWCKIQRLNLASWC